VREIHVKTKVNLINGKNNNGGLEVSHDRQVNANMRVVYNLLGDDTQEEAAYESNQAIAA
jgi:hypothetical protein